MIVRTWRGAVRTAGAADYAAYARDPRVHHCAAAGEAGPLA